jgi:hypothetical protein
MEAQILTTDDGEKFSIVRPGDDEALDADLARLAAENAREDAVREAVVTFENLPLTDLVEERQFAMERIEAMHKAIAEATMAVQAYDHELYRRMAERNALALAHPDYEITYARKKTLVKNEDAFKECLSLSAEELPKAVRDKIIAIVQPPPVLKTDATALKTAAKTYGGKLNDILAKALVYEDGPIKVSVTRKTLELTDGN